MTNLIEIHSVIRRWNMRTDRLKDTTSSNAFMSWTSWKERIMMRWSADCKFSRVPTRVHSFKSPTDMVRRHLIAHEPTDCGPNPVCGVQCSASIKSTRQWCDQLYGDKGLTLLEQKILKISVIYSVNEHFNENSCSTTNYSGDNKTFWKELPTLHSFTCFSLHAETSTNYELIIVFIDPFLCVISVSEDSDYVKFVRYDFKDSTS
jgi:hypothetical protein